MKYDIISRRKTDKILKASYPEEIYNFLKIYADCRHEMFFTITINISMEVLGIYIDSVGTLDSSLVHARDVFYNAILDNAHSIIIAHNHPAGGLKPSKNDLIITKDLKNAGKILQIKLIDHIIFSKKGYNSLRIKNAKLFNYEW